MTTITQVVTTLPTAPDPVAMAPSAFNTAAAAFVLAQQTMVPQINTWATQANTVGGEVSTNATNAAANATSASASAASAAASAGVTLWVSGSTTATGANVYSPITFLTYRRNSTTPGSTTTDPSADGTRWVLLLLSTFPVTIVSTTTQTAVAGNEYVLTNVAASTVTLPASPNVGDKVIVKPANSLATNVINPNGATVEGVSGNLTIDNAYAVVNLQYLNSSWRLV